MSISQTVVNCRSCKSPGLESILDLGFHCLNDFLDPTQPDPPKVKLELLKCSGCQLVQLSETVNPDLLYRNFHYRSSITQTMRDALNDIVKSVSERIVLSRGDTVIDIGSNDSTLLRCYPSDLDRLGFEPALNLAEEARDGGITVVSDYFTYDNLRAVSGKNAQVITAIAMFYDLNDPNSFLNDVSKCLSRDGIFVIQMAYLPAMLRFNDISNICHEHLEYYSLASLEPLLHRHGLYVSYVEQNSINGGSARFYIAKYGGAPVHKSVHQMRDEEKALGLDTEVPYQKFAQRAQILRGQVRNYVFNEVKNGRSVYLYGASTKGNTLLQYWGLDRDFISGAADRDSRKWGKCTPNSRINIVSEETARGAASSFLVLPFFFKNEFVKRESEFLNSGRKMVFPLPEFEVIGGT